MGVDEVLTHYQVWLADILYVVCYRFNYSLGEYQYRAFRSVKRGDEKYSFLTCQKFKRLGRFGKDLIYFNSASHDVVKGSGLLLTFEYNANVISLKEAWQNIGVDLNRSASHIRKLFGNFSMIRVFEAHASGYPHIHAMLIFHDYVFSGKLMYSSNENRKIFRVAGSDYDSLKRCWRHGFSDSRMVDSYQGGIRYLSKYLVKSTSLKEASKVDDSKGAKTLALCWILHKRSFSISGVLFTDEISSLCNSNLNSTETNSDVIILKVGMDLYLNPIFERVTKWRLFGFCLRDSVLWADWRGHFVARTTLVCLDDWNLRKYRSHYEILPSIDNLALPIVDSLVKGQKVLG